MNFGKYLTYNKSEGKLYWKVNRGLAKAGNEAGDVNHGQRRFGLNGEKYYVSTVVWFLETGEFTDKLLEHIDGNSLNDRFTNLRIQSRDRPEVTTGKYKHGKV